MHPDDGHWRTVTRTALFHRTMCYGSGSFAIQLLRAPAIGSAKVLLPYHEASPLTSFHLPCGINGSILDRLYRAHDPIQLQKPACIFASPFSACYPTQEPRSSPFPLFRFA